MVGLRRDPGLPVGVVPDPPRHLDPAGRGRGPERGDGLEHVAAPVPAHDLDLGPLPPGPLDPGRAPREPARERDDVAVAGLGRRPPGVHQLGEREDEERRGDDLEPQIPDLDVGRAEHAVRLALGRPPVDGHLDDRPVPVHWPLAAPDGPVPGVPQRDLDPGGGDAAGPVADHRALDREPDRRPSHDDGPVPRGPVER